MALSDELIRDFAKTVSSIGKEKSNNDVVLYGTARVSEGSVYVLIDGASDPTPAITTMTVSDGERVTLTIKHHTAMITGNLDSPGARKKDSDAAAQKADNAQNTADEALEKMASISGKYLHIMYATDSEGTDMSDVPNDDTKYMGIYSGDSEIPPTDPDAYQWTLIKGVDGVGVKGEDGKSSYLHVKYSGDGSSFTANNGEDPGDWIGTCVTETEKDPDDFNAYTWVKIKGEDGAQGLRGLQGEKGEQGVAGTDGKTTYFHIKYSDIATPTMPSQITETPSTYIGTYVDFTSADSTDPSKYTWSRFKGSQGEKGDQGIPGVNGIDGNTSYLHIAYANSADGATGFSVSDSDGKMYIGQYTDFAIADSTDPSKYTWSKIRGEDGKEISKIVEQFYLSTSKTALSGGSWSNSQQAYASGKYYWTRYQTTWSDDSITYSSPVLASSLNDMYSTTIGGRNLLLGTRNFDDQYYSNTNASISLESISYNGSAFTIVHTKRDDMTSGQYVDYKYKNPVGDLKPATQYTLSFWAKGNGVVETFFNASSCKLTTNIDGYSSTRDDGQSLLTLSDEWKRYWITWTTKDAITEDSASLTLIRIMYSTTGHATEWYMYAPKLEVGNKATDWTPAPEDTDSDLKDLDSNIRDTISNSAKDTLDAAKYEMDSKLDGYVKGDDYGDFKQNVEAKFEVLDSDITMKFNTITSAVDSSNSNTGSKFSELAKYIRYSENGIEIGVSENVLKLSLDNDMIKFTKNGEPIGWWDGTDFHTGNLIVEVNERAQFGNFAFVPRSDGSLMFLKVKD